MKIKLQRWFNYKLVASAAFTGLINVIVISSCTKTSTTNGADQFIGTWTGSVTCSAGGTPTSNTVTLTGSGNTLNLPANCGSGTCYKAYTFSGTVNGSTFSLATTTFQDNCGKTYTVAENGSLNGNTLTLVMTATTPTANSTCTFTGTK